MTTKRRASGAATATLLPWITPPALLPFQEPEPEPQVPVLSPEAEALILDLNGYGVIYNHETACKHCGCPLTYALADATRYCCRCWPLTRRYGSDRQERIETLWPRTPHNEW